MASNKEKIKLNKVLDLLADVHSFNEPNLLIVTEAFEEYNKIIRVLHKQNPNVFANLYKHDLAEIRGHKRNVKEDFADEAQQAHFQSYRDALINASESAIEYITDYTQL